MMNTSWTTCLAGVLVATLGIAGSSTALGQSPPLPLPLPQSPTAKAAEPASAPKPGQIRQATGRRPSAIPGNVFPKEGAYRPTSNPAAFSALRLRPFQLEGQNNSSREIDPRRPSPAPVPPRPTARFDSGVGLAARSEILRSQGNRSSVGSRSGGYGYGSGYGSGRNSISLGFFMGGPGGLGGVGNGFVLFGIR